MFTGSLPLGRESILLQLTNRYIIPSVRSYQPLIANPQDEVRLQNLIQAAASKKEPVPELPKIALDVSGKTYYLDQNSLGWKDMTFIFQPEAGEAILRMSGSPDMNIGLDNIYRITQMPYGRPLALRGNWSTDGQFLLDFNILGELIESTGRFRFSENRLDLKITNHNFGGPPMSIQGSERSQ